MEIPCQHQGRGDLHQFGGLYAGDANIQPAARAVDDIAFDRHAQQQYHTENEQRQCKAHQKMGRHIGDYPHHHQCHQHVDHLPAHTRPARIRCAVQNSKTHPHQQQHSTQQWAVNVPGQQPREATQIIGHHRVASSRGASPAAVGASLPSR